jgi:glutaminyl-peptide cyclotransferase
MALLGLLGAFALIRVNPGRGLAGEVPPASPAQHLSVQVIATHPHDASSFTEGLVLRDGQLYESGGLYGESKLEEADVQSGALLQQISLDPAVFGEGLALVRGRLIQLTWKEQTAYVYHANSFEQVDQFTYQGEGWGLCYDGRQLVMSDGSSKLTFRDPDTFATTGTVPVVLDGKPVERVNELECVGDSVYANVWLTDQIIRIDEATGTVTGVIDASGLLTPEERRGADVLNGIAYDPDSGHFLITGKYWPKLFEVQFVG